MCNKDCGLNGITNRRKRSIGYSKPIHVELLSQGPMFKPDKNKHTAGEYD